MPDMGHISLTKQKAELSFSIIMIRCFACLAHGRPIFNTIKKIGDFHIFYVKFTNKRLLTSE